VVDVVDAVLILCLSEQKRFAPANKPLLGLFRMNMLVVHSFRSDAVWFMQKHDVFIFVFVEVVDVWWMWWMWWLWWLWWMWWMWWLWWL
jgi:hypothetical protein